MALDKLEEMGYKPRKRKEKKEKKAIDITEKLSKIRIKRQTLELLIEGLVDSDLREIIIYGIYVKKHLASFIPTSREKRIEKTLEALAKTIDNFSKTTP